MTKYRLKKGQEKFTVVDGPLAGRSYGPGRDYDKDQIPAGELKRFEKVKDKKIAAADQTNKTGDKSS
ncbi:MAG: hypothetical protein ABFS18_02155 [Thermodesulfobacteriota bacterium]